MNNPNSFDEELKDAEANPDTSPDETEQKETVKTPDTQAIDYETKFRESAKEAQRLYAENKRLHELHEEKLRNNQSESFTQAPDTEFFPGFEELDEDARNNLVAYTNAIKKQTLDEVYKDPAIAFARTSYNEKKWEMAFSEASKEIPALSEHATDFRSKYYNPSNVPDNMAEIIKDLAKIYLFDSAKEQGAKEEAEKAKRIDLEDITGGDKSPIRASRSLEDWHRMARENPAKFASLSKEFNEDLAKE